MEPSPEMAQCLYLMAQSPMVVVADARAVCFYMALSMLRHLSDLNI